MINPELALDEAGERFEVPDTAVTWQVKRQPEGKIGRPARVMLHGQPFELSIRASWKDVAILPSGVYRLEPRDGNNQKVGKTAIIEISHLDDVSGRSGSQADPSGDDDDLDDHDERAYAAHSEALKLIEQLQDANRQLHESQLRGMETMRQAVEKTMHAQVELTKHLANVIEAAARTVDASHGAGLSNQAEQIKQIWDSVPEGSNNLATVLNSPVVAGAAHALQKLVADAARQGAEAAAESHNQASAAAAAAAAAGRG